MSMTWVLAVAEGSCKVVVRGLKCIFLLMLYTELLDLYP